MKRHFALFLSIGLIAISDAGWLPDRAFAQQDAAATREAFDAARQLGTADAWNAFLKSYPSGFYADLARAYIKNLAEQSAAGRPGPPSPSIAAPSSPLPLTPAPPLPAIATTAPGGGWNAGDLAPTDPGKPAVARGGTFMGFAERFNRYYTDPAWKPSRILYVSPGGAGNGAARATPMSPAAAVRAARPGTMLYFTRGAYQFCIEFGKDNSGTYDEPVVVYGERNDDGTLGVTVACCATGRQTCINLEAADYVAVDGFRLNGGRFGVRAIGAGYSASLHSRGIAVIDCDGRDQDRDPFFSAQADWAIWERNVATGARAGDGHGIYLSNGGDWNIVRYNETFNNHSSDFQINADPQSTCKEEGIAYDDPRCDAFAGTGEGGQGASDYFLIDSNFFHHGASVGPNFTSVRRSVVRNNIFGIYPRHGVSFWQETDNPKLGSSENRILHNLFITTGRHAVKFERHSTRNEFINNILLGVRFSGNAAVANPQALLMDVDGTVNANIYRGNFYGAGRLAGRSPASGENVDANFSPAWFVRFPVVLNRDPNDFRPTAQAPFRARAIRSPLSVTDRYGALRREQVNPGPIDAP